MVVIKRLLLVLVFINLLLNMEVNINTLVANAQAPLPIQCTNYTNLTVLNTGVDYQCGIIVIELPSSLHGKTLVENSWYRYNFESVKYGPGLIDSTKDISGRQNEPYEIIRSKACFGYVNQHGCEVVLTHCGAFYVFQSAQFICSIGQTIPVRCNCTDPLHTTCNIGTRGLPRCPTSSPTRKTVDNKSDDDVLNELNKKANELYGKNITDESRKKDAKKIIDNLLNLTDLDKMDEEQRENGIDPQNLIVIVRILQKIVHLNISDSSFNILGPASNILDIRNTKSWRNMTDNKVIRDLVITLENYGFQCGENLKTNSNASTIVQLRVRYIKHVGNLSLEERFFKFPNASFNLSPNALPKESGALVVVLWYKTIHSFIRNSSYGDNVYAAITSKIITASVRPEPRSTFSEPVRISWDSTELNDFQTCAYWKPELSENGWKTDGCERVKDSNRLICKCYHLTAFAVMDISRDMLSKDERGVLELISTIGCSVSLLGVFLTILTHALLWKRLHQNAKSKVPSQVLMHLCVAIGMTDILAILAGPALKHETFCVAVSILLYFFVLALFGWMLCEGIIIYLQLVNVFSSLGLGGKHLKGFYVIGWGIPVVVVSVCVGVRRQDFITKRACWCGGDGVLFWTFVCTTGLILLINLVIFILALRSALSKFPSFTNDSTTLRTAKVGLKGSAILLPLLGLTWVFGLLVFNRDTIVFKYLFAICNSLQGLMIFVFHALMNKKVHEAINREKQARNARHTANNTCGAFTTPQRSPDKSTSQVTLVSLKKNNNSTSLIVKNNYYGDGNANLKPDRSACLGQCKGVQLEAIELTKL